MDPATASGPFFMRTPLSAIPHIQRETVFVHDDEILLDRPAESNRLLDDPHVHAANVRDDYMPYWADIWPASRMMAKVVLREPFDEMLPQWYSRDGGNNPRPKALELGCGLGLAGIAALKRGFHVIFSDYDCTALEFAERNARLNGFQHFETMALDWRFPPADLRVPLILAADLTYELRNIDPLLRLIQIMLAPGGVCMLTDPDRTPAPRLRQRLEEEGFPYTTEFVRTGEPGGFRVKGTLYRIRLPERICEPSPRLLPSE